MGPFFATVPYFTIKRLKWCVFLQKVRGTSSCVFLLSSKLEPTPKQSQHSVLCKTVSRKFVVRCCEPQRWRPWRSQNWKPQPASHLQKMKNARGQQRQLARQSKENLPNSGPFLHQQRHRKAKSLKRNLQLRPWALYQAAAIILDYNAVCVFLIKSFVRSN